MRDSLLKRKKTELSIVVHAINLITQRQRQSELFEFKASLVYRVSFKIGLHKEILSQKTKQNKTG